MPTECFQTSGPLARWSGGNPVLLPPNVPGNLNQFDIITGEFIQSWDTGHNEFCCVTPLGTDIIVMGAPIGIGHTSASTWGLGPVCRFSATKDKLWTQGTRVASSASGVTSSRNWLGYATDINGGTYLPDGTSFPYFYYIDASGANTPITWITGNNSRVWASRFTSKVAAHITPFTFAVGTNSAVDWSAPLAVSSPHSASLDPSDKMWVVDFGGSLRRYDNTGLVDFYNTAALTPLGLRNPIVVYAIDGTSILLLSQPSSAAGYRLSRFSAGTVTWTTGTATFSSSTPIQIEVDTTTNSVLVLILTHGLLGVPYYLRRFDLTTGALQSTTYSTYKMVGPQSIRVSGGYLWVGGSRNVPFGHI